MSEIKVDTLTGKTTAGDITVTSEGGAATMQMQQGLAKSWVNLNGSGTIAIRDSLNVASLTDYGTGDYRAVFTNSMNNVNHSIQVTTAVSDSPTAVFQAGTSQTLFSSGANAFSSYVSSTGGSCVAIDAGVVNITVHGDLA